MTTRIIDTYNDIDLYINRANLQPTPLDSLRTSTSISASLLEIAWRSPTIIKPVEQSLINRARQAYEKEKDDRARQILEWYNVIEIENMPEWRVSPEQIEQEIDEEEEAKKFRFAIEFALNYDEPNQKQQKLLIDLLDDAPLTEEDSNAVCELLDKAKANYQASKHTK